MTRARAAAGRIGIFGGTFDPVHHGHLIGARDALEQQKLDLILFVPCAQSPHKLARTIAPAKDRVAMLRAACRGESRFWISTCEIDRPPPSYAIDTVNEIGAAFPGAELWWILGEDQLPKLATWEKYDTLRKRVKFLTMSRPGVSTKKPRGLFYLPKPRLIDISASEIRSRAKDKLPYNHLLPASVARHIERRSLYQ